MRVIGEIPHAEMRITIFYMNQKYLLKFERNGFEQTYKLSEFDYIIKSVEELKIAVNEVFVHKVNAIFIDMEKSLYEAMKDYL
jgi:hypothetical protein